MNEAWPIANRLEEVIERSVQYPPAFLQQQEMRSAWDGRVGLGPGTNVRQEGARIAISRRSIVGTTDDKRGDCKFARVVQPSPVEYVHHIGKRPGWATKSSDCVRSHVRIQFPEGFENAFRDT